MMTKPTRVKEGEGPLQFMKDNAPTKQLNVRITLQLLNALKIESIENDRSLQDFVIEILKDHLKYHTDRAIGE